MVKIFFNYLREQRKNIIQVLGLGFLVMIMIITFLSIQFSNRYVKNQYLNDITHHTNFQELNEAPIEENIFEQGYNDYKADLGLWLANMWYYNQNNTINIVKLKAATFQIVLVSSITDTYRFIFNGSSDITNPYANNFLQIGNNIASKYQHNYVDFKLLVPNEYAQGYSSAAQYKATMRNLINSYVYDGSSNINQVNYFILNNAALKIYQDEIYHKLPYANREYQHADIACQSQLYFLIINGMLFQNIEWNQYTLVNDLLITGKSFLFTQTIANNVIDPPILVGNYQQSLEQLPLRDNEILIYEQFANSNHLKIGDKYNIINRTFTIRGFATSRNSTYLTNNFSGMTDPKNKTVAFVNSNTMININHEFKGFINENKRKSSFNPVYPQFGLNPWLYNILHKQLAYGHHYQNLNNGINFANVASILIGDDYLWKPYNENAIFFLNERIKLTQNVGIIFLGLIFMVTSVIILMVVWKMIHHNHKLIGILKAMGYKNWQLTITLVLTIIWPLFIFAIIGILIAVISSHVLINSFSLYLALINYGWYIDIEMIVMVLTMPLLLLASISFFIVYLFLQNKPLYLISSKNFKKYHYLNISKIFRFISIKVINNISYRNKLAITISIRSFGKLIIISTVSVFAATLMLFSVAASGLVNDMLYLQYQGINFNYLNSYHFDKIHQQFINSNNQLVYTIAPVSQVKTKTSIKQDLIAAIDSYLANPSNPIPVIRDLRNKYILSKDLLTIRKIIEKPTVWNLLPTSLKEQWIKQENIINYLTNNSKDLLISFGIIPYQEEAEIPFIKINIENSYDLDFSNNNVLGNHYNSVTQTFNNSCFINEVIVKQTMYGVNGSIGNFIKPNLLNSKFNNFTNLNIKMMETSHFWLDKKFMDNFNMIKQQLHITSINAPNVTFLPIAASNAPISTYSTGNGNNIGKAILYPYLDFSGNQKYLVGIVYDGFSNLDVSTVLVSHSLLNSAINEGTGLLINNAKMSKFNDNELQHYLTFINIKNNYDFDLTKLLNPNYINASNFISSLNGIMAIGNEKSALTNSEISIQLVIGFFAICSIVLSFTIMTLITNILVRDNWILINILKLMGYNNVEVAYNFIVIIVPLILFFSIFSVFIAPILIKMLAQQLILFSKIIYPIIFHWWYFLLAFGINMVVYVSAYIITWWLNFRKYKLWAFIE